MNEALRRSPIRVHRRPWPGLALLLAALAVPAARAQPRAKLELPGTEAFVNEPFTVSIQVDHFETCDPPTFPALANATAREMPGGMDSSRISIVDNRKTVARSRSYLFEITATAVGDLLIPPVKVKADGRTLLTKATHVKILASDTDQLLSVTVSCDRRRIYVGQRVRLTLTVQVKAVRVRNELLDPEDLLNMRLLSGNLAPFPRDRIKAGVRRDPQPDGSTLTYYTYETWTDYVPDRPGPLSFDDVEIRLSYPTSVSRDIFGRLEPIGTRNLHAKAQAPEIETLALPSNGRPPNFAGAVGTFGITVAAQPTSVRVGDPIQLTIEIRGDGPIESLPPPDLTRDPRLTQSFRIPSDELAGEATGNRKRFTQIIRAQRTDVTEIPPLEYPYFDPDRELYVVALSEPIPIAVLPAAQLDTGSLVESSAPPSGPGATPLHALDGLRGNETRESQLLATAAATPLNRLAFAMLTPPCVFLAVWGYTLRAQSRGPRQRRRQSALRLARQRLAHTRGLPSHEAAVEIAAALTGYLADRLDQPPAHFVGPAAVDFLAARKIAPAACDAWRGVLERCERISFGATIDGDTARLAHDAGECLRTLEHQRL